MEQEIKRNLPRDVFLHLLAIVTLYWSSVTFIMLLWQFINYFFPDVLNPNNYFSVTGPFKFAISSLIVVFPVFIGISRFLNKIYAKEALVRESKIRKWLLYLTLFISALAIIVDLVAVINTFLNGEITTRFILKALSVIAVAGVVFGYYIDDVRRETPTKLAKSFAWGSGILVLVAIVGAFFVVGSPQTARLIQFDQQKVSNLQEIQSQIIYYWQKKDVLPDSLDQLTDPLSNFKAPVDPQANQPYAYKIVDKNALSFQLCATFNKEGNDMYGSPARPMSYPSINTKTDSWQHSAGDFCFDRTIDKQLYEIKK